MSGLVARNVVVRFGGLVALDSVSVAAPRGRITGLIGPNGAGKTTLFNVCSGYQRPEGGSVELNGTDVTRRSVAERARLGLGRTFQRMELFGSLTVAENVELAAEASDMNDDPLVMLGVRRAGRARRAAYRACAAELVDRVGLGAVADRPARQLSTGQGRLLELARCLAREPSIVLLDEPSSGLDGAETARFGEVLTATVADRQLGLLVVEHDMSLVLEICEHLFVLDFGKPLFEGSPAQVRANAEVRAAYLGQELEAAG